MGRKNKSSVNHHRIETKQQNKISNSNARHELKLYKQLNECDSNSFSNHYTKSNLSDSQKLIYLAVGVMVLSGTAIAAGQEIKERKSTGQYSKTPKASMKINNKNLNELKVNISNADNISLFHDLPCVDKALKIAVKEKENFLSSDQRNIIRPGIYVKAHKISKQDMENYVLEIAELVVEHKKEKEQQFMEKLGIWSIDYGVSVNNFYERHNAEEIYKFVETELLEKLSHNKIDPKSMISTLIRINEIITGKDFGIREQPVIVSKSRGEDAPDLFNIDQMKQYLLKHDDSSISHYDDLCERFYEKSEEFPIDKKIDIWTNIIFDIFKNPNDPLNDFASQYYYFENSSSQSIKFKLRKLFQELNEKIKIDPIEAIAHTTIKFLEIHPFVDGNGRIARTLENLLLKKVGLPTIAHYSNKEYMDAIVKGTFEDLKFYTDYLRKMICDATAIKSLGLSDGKVTETIEDILTFCLGLGYNCKNAFESIFKDESKDITATPVEQLELAGENLIT